MSTDERWGTRNSILLGASIVSFGGAVGVFLLGVVLTHGVYGSRMAWLLGVVVPLLALAALLAWLAASTSSINQTRFDRPVVQPNSVSSGDKAAKTVFGISLTLVAVPFALAGLILAIYGLLFIAGWLHH